MKLHRGSGPLVSVIMTTRGRPAHLLKAIHSLQDLAVNAYGNLEVLIKVDSDDTKTIDTILPKLSQSSTLIVGPRGKGFADLWWWDNHMARMAKGDWLLIFNDDAEMLTDGWDKKLVLWLEGSYSSEFAEFACLGVHSEGQSNSEVPDFMFVRRKVVEVLGHYARSPIADTWIWIVLSSIEATMVWNGVGIRHAPQGVWLGSHPRGWHDNEAFTAALADFHSDESRRLMAEDVNKLVKYINEARTT